MLLPSTIAGPPLLPGLSAASTWILTADTDGLKEANSIREMIPSVTAMIISTQRIAVYVHGVLDAGQTIGQLERRPTSQQGSIFQLEYGQIHTDPAVQHSRRNPVG